MMFERTVPGKLFQHSRYGQKRKRRRRRTPDALAKSAARPEVAKPLECAIRGFGLPVR